ncbi:CHAT domain-containing protein [Rhizobium ruizarguesonis]
MDENEHDQELQRELSNYGKCAPSLFLEGLIWSDVFEWMKQHKEELVFMPSDEAAELEKEERLRVSKGYLDRFYAGLATLSSRHKTLALIYSESSDGGNPYTCVWLASSAGLVAYTELTPRNQVSDNVADDDFLQLIWNGLRVDVRSASRAPSKREGDTECEDDSAASDITPTVDQIAVELTTLQQAKSYLLPDSIASELERESTPGARLLIIPSRSAQKIPFAAFPMRDRSLIDLYSLMIVPAPEDIIAAQPDRVSAKAKSTFMVVGDPDLSGDKSFCWPKLPHAREEAALLADKLGTNATTGASADFNLVKANLKSGQKTLRLIYFATHGMTDPKNPADGSFLALTKSHLTGAALRKMKLKFVQRPIVVMSACFSGLGKVFPGGVFGLTDFWLKAGASQVVVSLWAVSDAGTRDLMALFAAEMSKQFEKGVPNADGAETALAVAMRGLKATERDPAVWAAFVVVGRPNP